jgi:stringent starvation protein B
MHGMTSSRPYLIRAIYEWLLDNNQTPYLLINAEHDGVSVPRQFIHEGQIILNVSPTATRGLTMSNENIVFSARFGGKLMDVYVPISATLSIYSKENGLGMSFQEERSTEEIKDKANTEARPPLKPDPGKRPKLTIVK